MELLKRIELRMEALTQDLERLPAEKVKIAQRVIFLNTSNLFSAPQAFLLFLFRLQYFYFDSSLPAKIEKPYVK